MEKPVEMFDREFEWSEVVRFASRPGPQASLGIVSGRRRQGKTFLLDALCRACGGFYFAATESTEVDSLRRISSALTAHNKPTSPYHFADWFEAFDTLLKLGRKGPTPVVIDEFPFLVKASPALPSIIQAALGPQSQRDASPVRILLCGSALSFMGSLLSGSAPLRGRAGLELVVPTLDFRLAAGFWQIADPRVALLTNAIVGGTPAYRREYVQDDVPAGMADFDEWVIRAVLNPARPLLREARYLLTEEPDLRDAALYHTVLAAIADGNAARGGIANYLGRKSTDLAHPLTVLEDVGLVTRDTDAFRANRSAYRIAEPLIAFYHAIMRPEWAELERPGRAAGVWQRSQTRFRSLIVGPHFEQVCRAWARWFAAPETFEGHVSGVGSGTVSDPSGKTSHEIDVAVIGEDERGRRSIRSIGEAKWTETMGLGHLERLRHLRGLLQRHPSLDTSNIRLACYSGAGFTPDLHSAAAAGDVLLVDLERLYYGT